MHEQRVVNSDDAVVQPYPRAIITRWPERFPVLDEAGRMLSEPQFFHRFHVGRIRRQTALASTQFKFVVQRFLEPRLRVRRSELAILLWQGIPEVAIDHPRI